MKKFKSIVLAISFAVLTLIYISFDYGFIQCKYGYDCQKMDTSLISNTNNAGFSLKNAKKTLEEKANYLNAANNTATDQNKVVANLKEKYAATSFNFSKNGNNQDLKNENLNANYYLKKGEEKQSIANTEKANAQTDLNSAYEFMTNRYSQRLIWIFFSAVFFALCLASIALSIWIIKKAFKTLWKTFSISIALFSAIFGLITYNSNYMSVFIPMLEQSIDTGDLAIDAVNLLNVIGFAATIFLIAASCAILYAIENLDNEIKPDEVKKEIAEWNIEKTYLNQQLSSALDENQKKPVENDLRMLESVLGRLNDKLDKYEPWRERLRLILYISALMLFVGIFRIDVVSDWHRLFVTNESGRLLEGFFTTSLSIQAGFYTLLLLMLYSSVSYFMPETEKAPDVQGKLKEGIIPTIKEFLPRVVMLILPLLAKPVADFVKYFFPS